MKYHTITIFLCTWTVLITVHLFTALAYSLKCGNPLSNIPILNFIIVNIILTVIVMGLHSVLTKD
jgi:hypothetical protein